MATKPLVSPEFSSIVSDLALKTLGAAVGNLPLGKMAGAVLSQRLRGTADLRRLEDKSRKAERYIVSAITTQQASAGPVVRESLRSIHDTLKSSIVQSENETGRKIMQLTPHEAALLKENYAGLVVERDVQFRLAAESPLIPQLELITVPASSRIVTIRLTDSGGTPIRNARVFLQPKPAKTGYRGKTNAKGLATLSVRKTDTSFHRVTVVPESGFWSKVLKNVTSSEIDVRVGPLTANGFDWGPQCCEALKREPHRGKGIRVAVIDTGVAKHAGLSMKSGHNFILDESKDDYRNDVDGHGTHCAGIVAALANQSIAWGYAPDAELAALRIFGGADGGGWASYIGDAIDWATKNECDIISMSFVREEPTSYIRQQIEKAVDAGVFLVAAAGNEGGNVLYPAKFREVAAVSAVGKFGAYPTDSIHSGAETTIRSTDGQFYLAGFSNRGDEIDFCAPGVAITSTYPVETHHALDGTSMACPQIAGIAALALNMDKDLAKMKRGPDRAAALFDKLRHASLDIGLSRELQGAGMPLIGRI